MLQYLLNFSPSNQTLLYLDQIYIIWSIYIYNTYKCIVPVIFFSKLLGVYLYTHVHILRPPVILVARLKGV